MSETPPSPSADIHVAPSPHLFDSDLTTRRMMVEVLFGMVPLMLIALLVFRWYAVVQVGLCVLVCLATEAVCACIRKKPSSIGDYSAVVTGVILGLSLPWSAPWYVGVIASVTAVGLGKVVFGGLGYNIFNPAMVGRAFVMLSFARQMGASAYVATQDKLTVLTQATPLSAAKEFAKGLIAGKVTLEEQASQLDSAGELVPLMFGHVNGSLGETGAIAILIGGIYLCLRKVASWQIPFATIISTLVFASLANAIGLTPFDGLQHILGGALLFGAFFIATDPVSSPMTGTGKLMFGIGIGMLVVLIRTFSGYPEGVMFAVLIMNAGVPLINRWTIPRPLGGPLPSKE